MVTNLILLVLSFPVLTMPRPKHDLQTGFCYHITVPCNNRKFRLTRLECRKMLLYAIKKAQDKYKFKLYALCIMSNHLHYLFEPQQPEDLPKIMHWLNLHGYVNLALGIGFWGTKYGFL